MKKISANYIFPGNGSPIKNGVIVLGADGIILDLLTPEFDEVNWDEVEQYEGIICPGFVNTHCHLELSYLKGKMTEKTQLHGFVKEIISIREDFSNEERQIAIAQAEKEMIANGIVAVGDIANGSSTFKTKENSFIKYHTFIEVFGSDPNVANDAFNFTQNLYNSYFNKGRTSLSPHATYSVSKPLIQLINEHCIKNNSLVSIHNQETESENAFYKKGEGELFEFLEIAKKTNNEFVPTGKNALPSFLEQFSNLKKVLLVHNTFTNQEDIEWAKNYSKNIYWCFCPNANEYIENKQPDYNLFINEKCTIGTDSLASNWSLSILDELKTISKKDATISLETLIKWATYNGAKFLDFSELGSIEKEKSPGLNLIKNVDLDNLKLTEKSEVTPL
jgi:aminodeoxyfutalosine deaminase